MHPGDVALLLTFAVALSLALPSFLGLGATVTTDRTERIDL